MVGKHTSRASPRWSIQGSDEAACDSVGVKACTEPEPLAQFRLILRARYGSTRNTIFEERDQRIDQTSWEEHRADANELFQGAGCWSLSKSFQDLLEVTEREHQAVLDQNNVGHDWIGNHRSNLFRI